MDSLGCNCVVCMQSRSNQRQAEIIKAQEAALARVRTLCDQPGYLTPEDVLAAIAEPADGKPIKRADQSRAKRATVDVHLPGEPIRPPSAEDARRAREIAADLPTSS
jgi:hypothetical protein